jgi:hypothetical protein
MYGRSLPTSDCLLLIPTHIWTSRRAKAEQVSNPMNCKKGRLKLEKTSWGLGKNEAPNHHIDPLVIKKFSDLSWATAQWSKHEFQMNRLATVGLRMGYFWATKQNANTRLAFAYGESPVLIGCARRL